MEIKEQLKEHRARLGLSQEELADRIFVSRQTISNWETDRTYPDVQSLLLMSDLFGTSIDELVKGDVATMEKTIENEWKTMSRLAMTAWVIAGLVLLGSVEHMKRKYDLVTYRDILAYSRGEEPPRDGAAFARRHPVMMGWVKGIVSAIAGFVVAVVLCRIFLG